MDGVAPARNTSGPIRPSRRFSNAVASTIAGNRKVKRAEAPQPEFQPVALRHGHHDGIFTLHHPQLQQLRQQQHQVALPAPVPQMDQPEQVQMQPLSKVAPVKPSSSRFAGRDGGRTKRDKDEKQLGAKESKENCREGGNSRGVFGSRRERQEETFDARFAQLKLSLMSSLVKRQQELSQTSCELCSSILLQPTRLHACRHALCGVCVESTLHYFSECPICAVALPSELPPDRIHDEVMQSRLQGPFTANLKQKVSNLSSSYAARLSAAIRDREHACRIVLEYGTAWDSEAGMRSFLRVLGVEKGSHCSLAIGSGSASSAEALISQVEFGHSIVRIPSPRRSASPRQNVLAAPNDEVLGYCSEGQSSKVACTVTWSSALSLAPLEIRFLTACEGGKRSPRCETYSRRIVVQLPPTLSRLNLTSEVAPIVFEYGLDVKGPAPEVASRPQTRRTTSREGGTTVLQEKDKSGWIIYSNNREARIYYGSRTFGRSATDADMEACSNLRMNVKASVIVGTPSDVGSAIGTAVSQNMSLSAVVEAGDEAATALQRSVLVEEKALPEETEAAQLCEETYQMLRTCPAGATKKHILAQLMQEDYQRPNAFYHVAIENLALDAQKGKQAKPEQLLSEVIKSLGKQFAFALISEGETTNVPIQALLQTPNLASFIILRDPQAMARHSSERFAMLMQPSLILSDSSQPNLGKEISSTLSSTQLVEYSSRQATETNKTLAKYVVNFFEENHWQGSLGGFGHGDKLPLLTSLKGGLRAWSGTKRPPTHKELEQPTRTVDAAADAPQLATP